jgi:UDP-glucose 4-epimerase
MPEKGEVKAMLPVTRWLITGGCGFIGSSIIRNLVADGGHSVRVVDNLCVGTRADLAKVCQFTETAAGEVQPMRAPSGDATRVELVVGDVLDEALALRAVAGAEVIVHLAANTGVQPSIEDPRHDCVTNVIGTLNYLEAARALSVRRFVLASSGAAVGEHDPPFHENLPARPVSPYAASKLAGEVYCSAYFRTYGVETVALRFGNVYGIGSTHKNSAVAKFIRRARAGQAIEIWGDGQQTRDFIYADDLINAVRRAATVKGVGGEIFQIATNRETTVLEMVDELKHALVEAGIPEPRVVYDAARPGEQRRNYADTSKAAAGLGWHFTTPLREGLRHTVAWFAAENARS